MPLVTWTDSLSIGAPQIDSDHKGLIALLNSALEARGPALTRAVIDDYLERLIAYAASHFSNEEALMVRIGIPAADADRHRREHIRFLEKVRFMKKVLGEEENTVLARMEITGFISDWLVNHIRTRDMALKPHVARFAALNGPL